MPSTINLTEYKTRYPQTAEFPTLSQSRMLGVLLARQRCKAARLECRRARRQARRRAVRDWLARCWTKLRATAAALSTPAFAGAAGSSWTSK